MSDDPDYDVVLDAILFVVSVNTDKVSCPICVVLNLSSSNGTETISYFSQFAVFQKFCR